MEKLSLYLQKDGKIELEAFADLNDSLNFSLHVGADSTEDNKIDVDISMMSARGLGVNGLQVSGDDDTKATAAIDTISAAIQKVSTQRSALGAVQNRLEHTINNLDNVVENTTSAESAIRDTNMATEMVKYSNNNILAQAGQAMLAQANQATRVYCLCYSNLNHSLIQNIFRIKKFHRGGKLGTLKSNRRTAQGVGCFLIKLRRTVGTFLLTKCYLKIFVSFTMDTWLLKSFCFKIHCPCLKPHSLC